MNQFIDIHTHNNSPAAHALQIVNVYKQFDTIPQNGWFSAGLHPWHLSGPIDIDSLQKVAMQSNILAIGECGLDKVCATDWNLQIRAFAQQIILANNIGKPLIIHCVRAWEEVMATLKQHKVSVPVIFHGFNKSNIASRLIDNGYYLSFGKALLKTDSPAAEVLRSIAANRYFLETDDADISIADIYAAAASLRETQQDDVILQLRQNFKTVFNR
ncbi:MAG: TatD family hydrolase [Chitinophagaceae bacterium]|nr:TatD family hydrolase [Chitinophagaceae bacterium]